MAKFDELLATLTPEDGIREDFVEGIKLAYDEDMDAVRGVYDTEKSTLIASHEAAIKALNDAHGAEITRIRNERYDNDVLGTDGNPALPETFGDESDDTITLDSYWVEENPGEDN